MKNAKFVKATKKVKAVLTHPADDKIIECALAVKADYVVSGDKHLLELPVHRRQENCLVNEFLKIMEKKCIKKEIGRKETYE